MCCPNMECPSTTFLPMQDGWFQAGIITRDLGTHHGVHESQGVNMVLRDDLCCKFDAIPWDTLVIASKDVSGAVANIKWLFPEVSHAKRLELRGLSAHQYMRLHHILCLQRQALRVESLGVVDLTAHNARDHPHNAPAGVLYGILDAAEAS